MPQSSRQMRASAHKSWVANAVKSVGGATTKVFRDIAPNITNTGAGLYAGGKKIRSTIRPGNLAGISRDLSRNKYVVMAKGTLRQSIDDLKKGNLYNADRADEAVMKAMGMGDADFDFDGFGDFDFGSDEDGGAGATFVNYNDTSAEVSATFALTGAVQKGTEANLAVGSAMIDTMMGMTSSMLSELQSGFGEMSSQMNTMNSTLSAILEFHNENTTKFYDAVVNAVSGRGGSQESTSYTADDDSAMDVFDTKGSINPGAYKEYLKKKLKRNIDNSAVGMISSFLNDETLEMMLADPVGGMTTALVGSMVPKVIERSIKEVDKTLGEFIPNMMLEMGKWATDETGIKKWIGKIFGVEPDALTKTISSKEITKDAATFDQITRNSIVEVLPKYARESTSYLREIAMVVTKKDNKTLLSGSEIFDARTNSYMTQDALMKNMMNELTDSIKSAFTGTDFGAAMQNVGKNLKGKDKESFESALAEFMRRLTTSDKALTERDYDTRNKDSVINKLLEGIGGKRDQNLLREAIQYLYDTENGIGSAARAQQDMRSAWNQRMRDMSENSDVYNLLALGIDQNTDMTEFLRKYTEQNAPKSRRGRSSRVSTTSGTMKVRDLVQRDIDAWRADENEYAEQQLKGNLAAKIFGEDFGARIGAAGGHVKAGMHRIMKGDSMGAMGEFGKIFTDQMKGMWDSARENFFKPLGEKIFGKDEEGNAEGFFAGTRNKVSDFMKAVTQKINGQEYTDSKGNKVTAEEGSSLVDKAHEMFVSVKDGVKEVLFGKNKEGEGDEEGGRGLFGTISDSLKQGFQGWKETIFGESENPDEEVEGLKKKVMDAIPNGIIGGAGGALIGATSGGSLLGMLVGGPVAGALIGTAAGFLSKSTKFQDYLFGPEIEEEDENGNKFKTRIGGLISAKTQNFFKENKNTIIGGAALGAVKSLVFPNSVGLLGSLVGGPIGGAIIGAGFGMLKKSQMFQEFLYGDEESGKEGIIQSFKKMFKSKPSGDGSEADDDTLKSLGMGAIGAAGGFLSAGIIGKMGLLGAMATPMGPLGGAIVGGAVGIAAGASKFQKFLFGEKDPDTGDRKGGLFQKFGNYLHVEILSPMKSKALEIFDDMKITLKYDILETIRLPFSLMADRISKSIGDAKKFISETVSNMLMKGYETFIQPVTKFFTKTILTPVRKVLGKATDILYNFSKMVITAPFRMVRAVGKVVTSKITQGITKVTKFVIGGAAKLFGFAGAAIKTVFSPFVKGFKGITDLIGGAVTSIKDRFGTQVREGTGIRGAMYRGLARLTSSEWRRGDYLNREERLREKNNAKANARSRRILDENRMKAARMLGYNVKYFDEDTMREAEEEARRQGKKLKFRKTGGEYVFDKDPKKELLKRSTAEITRDGENSDDMDIRHLTEQHRTNELLERILESTRNMEDLSEEDQEQLRQNMIRQAREAGFDYDPGTGKFTPRDDHGDNDDDQDQDEGGKRKSAIRKWMDKYTEGIHEAGGIGKYIKNSIKEGYEGSDLQNMIQGGRERVQRLFRRGGATRAEGGPAGEHQPLLVGDRDRSLNSAEIFVPRTEGTIIPSGKKGINVNIVGIEPKAAEMMADKAEKKSIKAAPKKGDYFEMRRALDEAKEIKSDNEREQKMLEVLEDIRDSNKEHQSIWSKIFSKKGLLTMGAIAVGAMLMKHIPTLKEVFDGIKYVITGVKDGIDSILHFFNQDREEDRNTDGKGSKEILQEKVSDLGKTANLLGQGKIFSAAKEFVLDDGEYNASSGGRAMLLAHGANAAVKRLPTIGRGLAKVGHAAAAVNNAVGQKVLGLKMASASGAKGVKGLLGKALQFIDDFIMSIVSKLGSKFAKIGESKIGQVIAPMVTKLKDVVTKQFAKISGKVAETAGGKGGAAAATLGVSEAVFITIGAINGLSGTARLFQVDEDHVDGTMRVISAAMGGLLGTTIGSIVDICLGLFADVTQIDFLNAIAVIIYRLLMGEDALKELDAAREEWRGEYDKYQEEEIRKEYETQKKAGIIGVEISQDQFAEGVANGQYHAGYHSFRDWNASQNQSIGYKIGNVAAKGLSAVGGAFMGKKSFTDANGQTYVDIGGGNYRVYSPSGEMLGEMTKDAIDASSMTQSTKGGIIPTIGKGFSAAGNAIGSGLSAAKDGVVNMFNSVSKGAKSLVDGGKAVVTALAQGEAKISQTFNNPETSISQYFNTDMNTLSQDHPMHGLVGGILNTEKVLRFPGLMVTGILGRVGREIAKFTTDVAGKVTSASSALGTGMADLYRLSHSGDTTAFDAWQPNVPEGTPVSGMISGILGAVKHPYWLTNRFYWVGNKVSEFFTGVSDKMQAMGTGMSADITKIQELTDSGDPNALWAYQPNVDESVPLAGVVSGLVKANAWVHSPIAGLNWIGKKASEFFTGVANGAKDIKASIGDYIAKLNKYADPDSDMSGFEAERMDDTTPIGMVLSPIVKGVMRFVVTMKRAFSAIGDFVGDKVEGAKDFFGGVAEGVGNAVGGAFDAAKNFATGGRGIGGRGSANGFSYYSQNDPAWGDSPFVSGNANDGSTMGDSGCGPTAMAMVASQAAKNQNLNPMTMANAASMMGFRDETGTNEQFIGTSSDLLGLQHEDVLNPSGAYIQQSVANGHPVILNGVQGGMGGRGSAFTKGGHYVVAVGLDRNGNVLVNDPRGRSYSKSYNPNMLAAESRKAWSFGGSGVADQVNAKLGGASSFKGAALAGQALQNATDNGKDWLAIVRSVKSLVAAQHPEYNQQGSMKINYNGEEWTLRPDCSGLVGVCLQIYGAIPRGTNVTSRSLLSESAGLKGFSFGGWPGWEGLKEGDIISRDGHVEIFGKNEGGRHLVYNGGSTEALGTAGMSGTGHKEGYSVVWRPGNAGTGAGAIIAADQGSPASNSGGFMSGVSDAASSVGSAVKTGANTVTDVLGKVGSVFTKFASKAMTGILTGKWDYDFSDKPADGTAETGGATIDSGTVEAGTSPGVQSAGTGFNGVAANITPKEAGKQVFAELRHQGATPAGAAGALGNLEAESGLAPNNLQNTSNKKLGMTDEQYTQAVDNGSYTNFVGDSAGYGLAQWTSSGRKQALLQLAQSQKKSIGDPTVQTQHLINELKGSYKPVWDTMTTTNDLKAASDMFLHKFEAPKDQSAAVENKRASLGQAYLNAFGNIDGQSSGGVASLVNAKLNGGVADQVNASLAGGRGTGNRIMQYSRQHSPFGGRGLLDGLTGGMTGGASVDSGMGLSGEPGGTAIPQVQTQSTNGVFSTKGLEDLLSAAIKVLESINSNTAKIEGLSTSISSISRGGDTMVVNKGGDVSATQTADRRNSTNATLAQKIARG